MEDKKSNIGTIPDFFFDIIAFIIPGYTILLLIIIDYQVMGHPLFNKYDNLNLSSVSISLLIAYVLGRLFEHFGYLTVHKKYFPFFNSSKENKPKWEIVFDENQKYYTQSFQENLKKKLTEWLKNQNAEKMIEECSDTNNKKDDYFNLIQFYLRERFPNIALYEKKQNATIVLTRSLFLIFSINIILYFVFLFANVDVSNIKFTLNASLWIGFNLLSAFIFYKRYHQDKIYHAMYIFEAFIATKKLLKSKKDKESSDI